MPPIRLHALIPRRAVAVWVVAALPAICLTAGSARASAQTIGQPVLPIGGLTQPQPQPQPPTLPSTGPLLPGLDQADGVAGTQIYDHGLYVHYCPGSQAQSARTARAASPVAHASHTSWAGWPAKQCLKMDKGPVGLGHVLVGLDGVHNWLLGGYGNDVIVGGDDGDVIWADYHPNGERQQSATIYAGNGRNVIYANDTHNVVWTGTNPATLVHAHNPGTGGVIHCQSPRILVYLSKISQRSFKLDGCHRISHFTLGY